MKDKIKLKRIGSVWLFVLPALIPLIVFWIYPILRSFYISMTDWDYMSPTYNFVFLENFKTLFHDARFYSALVNTLVFTLGTLIPTIVLGLLLALLLQKSFKGNGIVKFILFSFINFNIFFKSSKSDIFINISAFPPILNDVCFFIGSSFFISELFKFSKQ